MSQLVADYYWLGVAFLALLWVVSVVVIVADDRDPTVTLLWILVFLLLPGFGLLFYSVAGRDWKRVHEREKWVPELSRIREPFMAAFYARYRAHSDAVSAKYHGTSIERLINAVSRERGNVPLPANGFEIWPSGAEYFPHLLEDIAGAKRFIHMQYYVWERDELTTKVCAALMERVRAGVEVRILTDFLGSARYRKDQLAALKAAGAHVGTDVRQLRRLNYRDHRKITVIDGEIGHTGGINIGQEYIDGKPRFASWRDTGVRLTGPAVAELQKLFASRWYEVFRESLYDAKYFPAADAAVSENPIMTHVVAQGIEERWSSSTRAHEIAISGAQRRVSVQSPYWVPDQTLLDVFINAALSGVEVRLMMTGVPDRKIAFHAAQSYWEPVLRAGVHVHLYMAGFLHAKSIIIDDTVSAVGTMNLDIRSLKLNQELMVWVYDEGIARRQQEIFDDDLQQCVEVTLAEIATWGRRKRFRNSASRLASNLL